MPRASSSSLASGVLDRALVVLPGEADGGEQHREEEREHDPDRHLGEAPQEPRLDRQVDDHGRQKQQHHAGALQQERMREAFDVSQRLRVIDDPSLGGVRRPVGVSDHQELDRAKALDPGVRRVAS